MIRIRLGTLLPALALGALVVQPALAAPAQAKRASAAASRAEPAPRASHPYSPSPQASAPTAPQTAPPQPAAARVSLAGPLDDPRQAQPARDSAPAKPTAAIDREDELNGHLDLGDW